MSAIWMYIPVFPGKVAIVSYVVTFVFFVTFSSSLLVLTVAEAFCLLSLLLLMFSIPIVKVVLCAHILGSVLALGMLCWLSGQEFRWFGFYAMAMSFFHFSEYLLTSIFNPHTLGIDSFLLNHSREYVIAAIASWVEYWLELYFLPSLKSFSYLSILGAVMVVTGESLRKIAMGTAGSNFTHLVQYRKRSKHELVTSGVYSWFRHPSYVGWFVWSVGTQVLLGNPVCLLGYTVASWAFFSDRIYDEEESLVAFFREEYVEYKRKVGTGLPFIQGYPLEEAKKLLERYPR